MRQSGLFHRGEIKWREEALAAGENSLQRDAGLFTAVEIAARIEALAAEIGRTIPADFVVVGLLKGATVSVVDRARALDRADARSEIEFMQLASYGLAKGSSNCRRSQCSPVIHPRFVRGWLGFRCGNEGNRLLIAATLVAG